MVLLSARGGILSPYLVFELFTGWPPGTELAIFSPCLGSYGKDRAGPFLAFERI